MDYSHNFNAKPQSNLFPTSGFELWDFNGLGGVKLPQAPTPPVKIPRDPAWWTRTFGAPNMVPKPMTPTQADAEFLMKNLLGLMGGHGVRK